MKTAQILLVALSALVLSGCSHSQWAGVELATQGASWLNPVFTVIHLTAGAGRALTDLQEELREKVEQHQQESFPSQSQGQSRTETE
jgi:hypothetical protein